MGRAGGGRLLCKWSSAGSRKEPCPCGDSGPFTGALCSEVLSGETQVSWGQHPLVLLVKCLVGKQEMMNSARQEARGKGRDVSETQAQFSWG